jgi:hypothetical protein
MTEEEIKKELEYMHNHPMFMTDIPENPEDNPYLLTLQSLSYEGNPAEVAKDMLEKSSDNLNQYQKNKKFQNLKEAMIYVCNAIDHVKEDSTVPDQVKFDLYYHRSNIQLLVRNYGYALDDLKSALFYVDNDEAYMTLIECHLAMENYHKALKTTRERIKKLTEINMTDKLKLYKKEEAKVLSLIKELNDKLEKMETFKNLENDEKLQLYDNLTRRGIKLSPQMHKVPANVEANIYIDEYNFVHFPVLILYEEFNGSDYIQDLDENTTISDIFDILFKDGKMPWDKEDKYNTNTVCAFFEVSNYDSVTKKEMNYYYPLRNEDKLIDILTNKKVSMSGFPVIVILSQINNFFPHFMKNKIILKRKY